MREQTAIDLENIVYYKDDTHYFVMTAKKQSLLERRVIIRVRKSNLALLKFIIVIVTAEWCLLFQSSIL